MAVSNRKVVHTMTKKTMPRAARRKIKESSGKASVTSPLETYDVLVLATMSAGKSSLINALAGRELLPSANEATTACLTSIEHRRTAKSFRGACYSHSGAQMAALNNASIEQVRAWNSNPHVKHIRLSGKLSISSPSGAAKVVLHDTPGPNNSQYSRHAEMMLEAVHTTHFKLLCYVLNAGQLGTWDDRKLLEQLHELLAQRSGYRLVFILNKVDLLDPERGEDVAAYVAKAKHYLKGLGFPEPVILPTMANLALVARKALSAQALTRVERGRLKQALDDLAAGEACLLRDAVLPDAIKARVRKGLEKTKKASPASSGIEAGERAKLEQLVVRSGIRTVEFLLQQRSIAD